VTVNWTSLIAIVPVLVKYGPQLLPILQKDEPAIAGAIKDIIAANGNWPAIFAAIIKWEPQLVSIAKNDIGLVTQFIHDLQASQAAIPQAATQIPTPVLSGPNFVFPPQKV
jgi:hypothetical protein